MESLTEFMTAPTLITKRMTRFWLQRLRNDTRSTCNGTREEATPNGVAGSVGGGGNGNDNMQQQIVRQAHMQTALG